MLRWTCGGIRPPIDATWAWNCRPRKAISCGFPADSLTDSARSSRRHEVFYKVTDYYTPSAERSILWNDPELNIAWPVDAAIASLSDKDRAAPSLAQFEGRS